MFSHISENGFIILVKSENMSSLSRSERLARRNTLREELNFTPKTKSLSRSRSRDRKEDLRSKSHSPTKSPRKMHTPKINSPSPSIIPVQLNDTQPTNVDVNDQQSETKTQTVRTKNSF